MSAQAYPAASSARILADIVGSPFATRPIATGLACMGLSMVSDSNPIP